MTVAALCFSPVKSGPQRLVDSLEVVAGSGIVGDRNFGSLPGYSGRNLTLIEVEEVEEFNRRTGCTLTSTDPRRNVVTRGVRLNAMVGKTFAIGAVLLKGVELCEPCGTLAGYLAGERLSKAEFIRQFTHRCGLRADVLLSGTIRVGDSLVVSR
jgi:MOSC domain-containing protein YiiM